MLLIQTLIDPVEFLRGVVDGAASFGTRLVSFVLAVGIVYLLGRYLLEPVVRRLLDRRNVNPTLKRPALKVTRVIVVFLAVVVALAVAGFGALLAALAGLTAALTLAIGFASQDVVSNLVAGVFIIADPKINIGDWIEWNDQSGVIEDISFRVSRVRTFDNELVIVPNAELANTAITNPVAKDRLRIQFPFGIGYGDDIDTAREIVLEEAGAHAEIMDDPATSVRLTELGASAVVLTSRFWIDDPDRADFVRVRSEYVQAVKERFDDAGIDMPYDYRQLTGELAIDADAEALVTHAGGTPEGAGTTADD